MQNTYIPYCDRQFFGSGKVIVRHPEKPPEREDQLYGANFKLFQSKTERITIDAILTEFPELGFVEQDIRSLAVGGKTECIVDLQAGDTPSWVNGPWEIEHHPTYWTSLGLPHLRRVGRYGSPDPLTHQQFCEMLILMGMDTTNRTFLVSVKEDRNSYGTFVFLDFYDSWGHQGYSFYGYGEHEHRERWKYDWTFNHYQKFGSRLEMDKRCANRSTHVDNVEYLLHLTNGLTQPQQSAYRPSKEGRTYGILADLLDEDAALIEMQDNPDLAALLDLLGDEEDN